MSDIPSPYTPRPPYTSDELQPSPQHATTSNNLNAHPQHTQRKPMWLIPVSIICGRPCRGSVPLAVAVGAEERPALDHPARHPELRLPPVVALLDRPPRGLRGMQQGSVWPRPWPSAYQSVVHSQTFPAMS